MSQPRIFVVVGGQYSNLHAAAHIRRRVVGNNCYQYLVWRDSAKVREYYLGKLTLRSIDEKPIGKKLYLGAPSKKLPIARAAGGRRSMRSVG